VDYRNSKKKRKNSPILPAEVTARDIVRPEEGEDGEEEES
jgi:hypothetical protein